jgi:hypothetical protein
MTVRSGLIITVCNLLLVFGLVGFWQQSEINTLRGEVRIYQQMQKLSDDQISELQYLLTSRHVDLEAERTRSYVSGVVDSITRPDHASEIWHAGYDRGQTVQAYTEQVDKAKTLYTETPVKSDN